MRLTGGRRRMKRWWRLKCETDRMVVDGTVVETDMWEVVEADMWN